MLISVLRKYDKEEIGEALKNSVLEILKDEPRNLNALVKACKRFANYPGAYKVLLKDKDFANSLKPVFKSDEFAKLYEEAEKYKEKLKEKWNSLGPKVNNYLTAVLGIDEDKRIKVNVVNPKFNTGTNNLKDNIFWGHYIGQNDPYYDVIYMMHESMHCMYPYKNGWNLEQKGICHALIELAIDNELRCVLEGNMENYSEGHKDNGLLRNKLLPFWCAFLGKSETEISALKNLDGADFSDYSRLQKNESLAKMNFTSLMNFCIENYRNFSVANNKNDIESKGLKEI